MPEWAKLISVEEPFEFESGWIQIALTGIGTIMVFSDGGLDWQPEEKVK